MWLWRKKDDRSWSSFFVVAVDKIVYCYNATLTFGSGYGYSTEVLLKLGRTRIPRVNKEKVTKRKGKKINKKGADASFFFSGLVVFKFGTNVATLLTNTFCQNITLSSSWWLENFLYDHKINKLTRKVIFANCSKQHCVRLKNWQIFAQITNIWIVGLVPHVTVEKTEKGVLQLN